MSEMNEVILSASRQYWIVKELLKGNEIHYPDTQPTICGSEYKKRAFMMKRGLDIQVRIVTFEEDWRKCGYWLSLRKTDSD